jgi:hypothetical protein
VAVLAIFNREAVKANSPGFQSRENVNRGLAKPQRGEGVRDREPPSLLRSFDHVFLGHHGLKPVAIRQCRSAADLLHVSCRTLLETGALNSLLAGQVMGSPLDS